MNDLSTGDYSLERLEINDALATFTTPNAIDPLLAQVRAAIDAFVPDVTTASGRKAIASIANKVAKAKVHLDNEGKKLADVQKEVPKKIDACRKHIRDTLDAWKDEVRAPLTEWEAKEDARIDRHKAAIQWLELRTSDIAGLDAGELSSNLASVNALAVGPECEEYEAAYAAAKLKAIEALTKQLAIRQQYEAEQAELARLRAADAERQKKDHEERIAREAAERATREAAAKAETERRAAEIGAAREREAAERRELELRLQAEQAERRAVEAEAKAKRDTEAKAAKDAAEQASREADRTHRATVNKAALEAFMRRGLDESTSKHVITLIAQKEIPNVSINY
jgi:colicin import membrane protein